MNNVHCNGIKFLPSFTVQNETGIMFSVHLQHNK